jgi:ribonuclease III
MTLPPNIIEKQESIYSFLETIGVNRDQVKQPEIMMNAFVHKSYAADYAGDFVHNERLEFLWDAILSAIIAKLLYQQYPHSAESDLTLYKIALVRAENLAEVAIDIGLDKAIFLGNWEERNNGRSKITILCDCLEAVLGYLYIDCGADTVEILIQKYILGKLSAHTDHSVKSYKSHLQELIQKNNKITPTYTEKEIGKDPGTNDILYESTVSMWDVILWMWVGTNKKKAQEQAAKQGYETLTSEL